MGLALAKNVKHDALYTAADVASLLDLRDTDTVKTLGLPVVMVGKRKMYNGFDILALCYWNTGRSAGKSTAPVKSREQQAREQIGACNESE